jgi:hypothetical protein
MVTAEFTRKPPRSRNPALVARRRAAARRVAKPDPMREFLSRHLGKLGLATTITFAVASALEEQQAERDEDLALVLKRYVGDALAAEVEAIHSLLEEPRAAEGGRPQ